MGEEEKAQQLPHSLGRVFIALSRMSVKGSVCHREDTEQLYVTVFTCLLALRNVYYINDIIYLKFITSLS